METKVSENIAILTPVNVSMREVVQALQDRGITLSEATESLTRTWIQEGLLRNGNNQSALAAKEGMHRNTLGRKMHDLGMIINKKWKQKIQK